MHRYIVLSFTDCMHLTDNLIKGIGQRAEIGVGQHAEIEQKLGQRAEIEYRAKQNKTTTSNYTATHTFK